MGGPLRAPWQGQISVTPIRSKGASQTATKSKNQLNFFPGLTATKTKKGISLFSSYRIISVWTRGWKTTTVLSVLAYSRFDGRTSAIIAPNNA